jgi:hypothetical protein
MSDDLGNAFLFGMGFGVLLSAVPMMMVGSWLSGMEYERVAIEAKVGEYNPKTGVFQYKKVEEDGKK